MFYKTLWWRGVFVSATVTLVYFLGSTIRSIAAPAKVFTAHLQTIQRQLPSGLSMRLPAKILLGGPADDEFIEKIIVRVNPTVAPEGITVDLLSCDNDPRLCWIGSFAVKSGSSAIARREYQRHYWAARPITLNERIRGYVLDDIPRQPSVTVSSVMWKQDGMFYSARFATPERQNMLYMALSMANAEPVSALTPTLRDLSPQSFR